MSVSDKITSLLSRSPGDVALEQIRKLYLRLYPHVIGDFAHKDDLEIAFESVRAELIQIKLYLQTHGHPVKGVVAGPSPLPVTPVSPTVKPTEANAYANVVPGGVPQPTGVGISIQPSRVDPDPIAIPPLNPIEPGL